MGERSGVRHARLGLLGLRLSVLRCGGECLADGGIEVVAAERAEGPALGRKHEEVPRAIFGAAPAVEQVLVRDETAAGDWWRTEGGEQLPLDAEIVALEPNLRQAANGG